MLLQDTARGARLSHNKASKPAVTGRRAAVLRRVVNDDRVPGEFLAIPHGGIDLSIWGGVVSAGLAEVVSQSLGN